MNLIKLIDCIELTGRSCKPFNGEKKYVSTGAVDVNSIDDSQIETVTYNNKPSRANVVVDEGDLLFAKMQATNKVLIIDKDRANNIYSTGFYAIKPKNNIISSKCLYHLVKSKDFNQKKDKECNGATQKALNNEGLSKIMVKLPDRAIQDRIVRELDCIDSIIESNNKQLSLLDELIKARFNEFFGDPESDKKYPQIAIKNLTKVVSGGTPDRKNILYWENGTVPWVKTTELQNNKIDTVEEYITEKGLNESSAKIVPEKTILIAMYGQGKTRGMTAILGIPASTNQACACILPSEKVEPKYLWQYMIMSYNRLRDLAQGGNQPNLNGSMIKNFTVLLPPKELQLQFVDFVDQIEKSKNVCQQKINLYQELLDTKMDEYFN